MKFLGEIEDITCFDATGSFLCLHVEDSLQGSPRRDHIAKPFEFPDSCLGNKGKNHQKRGRELSRTLIKWASSLVLLLQVERKRVRWRSWVKRRKVVSA